MNELNELAYTVKQDVPMDSLLRMYGIEVNRAGFALCPFHSERHGSFKVYKDGAKCFGCGWHGDQYDFVHKMFGTQNFVDSLEKIISDFGLPYRLDGEDNESSRYARKEYSEAIKKRQREEEERKARRARYEWLESLYIQYEKWIEEFEPKPFEPIDSRYEEAIKNIDRVKYELDAMGNV